MHGLEARGGSAGGPQLRKSGGPELRKSGGTHPRKSGGPDQRKFCTNGQLVLHDDASRAAALIAGGIAITPFRAMVVDAAHRRLPHRLYLFYSNRRPQDGAFLPELQRLEEVNPSYRLIATMTAPQKSTRAWAGETGLVRRDMLERHLPDLRSPICYFAGPPAMTMAMQQMLEEIGIDGQAMRSEEFYGY